MLIGYARVSKSDGSQVLDLQIDALIKDGVKKENIYTDRASGAKEDRVGLEHCLKALRSDDILVVWKLDRLGRSLKHLISTVDDLTQREIGFKVLSGQGVDIDTKLP
jgi:DNA invertase Pin-like site-specific DNA recombinase